MSAVFLKLLNMSMAAGWLVAAVIVLRFCLKKAPKAIHCALWALVAVRLLCPVSPESEFSLIPENVANGTVVSEWADGYVGDAAYDAVIGREPIPAGGGGYDAVTQYDALGKPAATKNTVVPVLSWVWLAGMLSLLLYAAISYLLIRARVRVSLNWKDNIWLHERVDSPFILGIIRPRIYLPFGMDEGQMNHVVAHEQAHLRRRDHWWKPLGFVLLAVYWFHPLMWVAYVLLCRDIELACDEKVIRDMSGAEKKAYSEALLACSLPRRRITACPLAFGEVGVKKRIASVLHYKKPAFWILVAALAASVVVAVCFLTNPKDSEEHSGDETPSDTEQYVNAEDHDVPDDSNVPEEPEPNTFSDIMGYSGYIVTEESGPHNLRSYYAVEGDQQWLIAETFGFGEAEDYVVDLDGDGITELVANVTYGGDGARRAYVYRRTEAGIELGDFSTEDLPDFYDWGVNSTWSEYDPTTGIFHLHYAQRHSEEYAVLETTDLERFRFEPFHPA